MAAKVRVCVHVIVLVLAFAAPLGAQENTEDPDERIVRLLEQQRARPNGEGVVIVGATLDDQNCSSTYVEIGRITGGKYQRVAIVPGMTSFLGTLSNAGPKGLVQGEYVIGSMHCEAFRAHITINGPHTKFHVAPGEVVDLGFLRIEHKTTNFFTTQGTARRYVEDTPPRRLAFLREKFPRMTQRMVKRHMIVYGPPIIDVKNPRSLF